MFRTNTGYRSKANRRFVALIMAGVLSNGSLLAWSTEGHQTVAIIAQQLLQESGQFAAVQALLGNLSFADIATCPDEIRELERNAAHFVLASACKTVFPNPPRGTELWHYINIPVSVANPTHADVQAACPKKCVLTQIDAYGQILADTTQPAAARLEALSFVIHFIGDVHQPLHDAERNGDAGGNAEIIRINGIKMNLHHAWDEQLVAAIDANAQKLAADLAPQIQAAQAEPKTQPEDWALQAFHFALADAYPGIPPANADVVATLSPDYQQAAEAIIRQQIARGGVRLAQFIAEKTTPAPPASTGQ